METGEDRGDRQAERMDEIRRSRSRSPERRHAKERVSDECRRHQEKGNRPQPDPAPGEHGPERADHDRVEEVEPARQPPLRRLSRSAARARARSRAESAASYCSSISNSSADFRIAFCSCSQWRGMEPKTGSPFLRRNHA